MIPLGVVHVIIRHMAGPYDPEIGVQKCVRCKTPLTDHSRMLIGEPIGDCYVFPAPPLTAFPRLPAYRSKMAPAEPTLPSWPEGQPVMALLYGDPPLARIIDCRPTEPGPGYFDGEVACG